MDETVNGWTQEDARCEQVPPTHCIWCKRSADDPQRRMVPIGTGEVLCTRCLGDCREFKRYRYVDIIYSMGLGPTTRRVVLDHWQAVTQELLTVCEEDPDIFPLPRRISHAEQYEQADTHGIDPSAE